jgi:hypothetical protein
MKTLYHVMLNNERLGWKTSFLISADDERDLRAQVMSLDLVGDAEEWQMTHHYRICSTPDNVSEEM